VALGVEFVRLEPSAPDFPRLPDTSIVIKAIDHETALADLINAKAAQKA
jgi:hypothetical protein